MTRTIRRLPTPSTKPLLQRFRGEYFTTYQAALKSGAVNTEELQPHDHLLAKNCLIIAAEQFGPLHKGDQQDKMLKNLRHFV